jgi:protein-tyrosine phosphatase
VVPCAAVPCNLAGRPRSGCAMIDLHCHILPAVDDGPADIEESVAMARTAADDGITHIVATPHFVYDGHRKGEGILRTLEMLRNRLGEAGIPVELLAGADIRLSHELLAGLEKGDIPTIHGSRYFLLELPEVIPPNLDRFLFAARVKGFTVIITHPERNRGLLSSPEKIGMLRASGSLFQLTAMSVTGEFGSQIRSFSQMLLRKGFADFVATDAHDYVHRRPVLSTAYRETVRLCGEREAERIFFGNPAAVLDNREILTG